MNSAACARTLVLAALCSALVFAGCGGDEPFTDAAVGNDARNIDGNGGPDADVDADLPDAEDDTTPPQTAITAGPSDPSTSASATFSFGADEPATFECQIDGGGFVACTSPHTYTALADGDHDFEVRATDLAGNVDATPATAAWRSDTVVPQTTITVAPEPIDNSVDVSFEFTSSEAGTFECRLDGGTFTLCTSPRAYTALADGDHDFEVRAIDLAGNVDATPALHEWLLDSTSPDTRIDVRPTNPTDQVDATFEFSSLDAGDGATFECRLDGATFASCTSPISYTGLTEGSHTFRVRVFDALGNVDPTPATATWVIDLTAPDTTIDDGPTGDVSEVDATFEFSSPEPTATFECQLDGGGYDPCVSPHDYEDLEDGEHVFEVRACDLAGNCDLSPATETWTIDTAFPDTTITGGPTGTVASNDPSFTFTSDDVTATFECNLDGAGFAACTSPDADVDLADGMHLFVVRACDAAGNCDLTPDSRMWTIDTTAPETTIGSGPVGTVASADVSFGFSSPELGATFECMIDTGTFASCASPHSYNGLDDGEHTFAVRACDSLGNCDGTPATRTWQIDTTAPETTIDSGPTGSVGSASATLQFSSPEAGATFECRLDAASFASCTSPADLSGLADGSHTFEVRACDTLGNCDGTPASRTWIVDTIFPTTTITGGPSGPTASDTATFTFTSDEPGTFQCRRDAQPFVACTTGTTFTGLTENAHTFEVIACDAANNCDQTPALRSWTVDLTRPETTITSGPSGLTASTTAVFAFSSTEAGTFQCRRDTEAFAACTSPHTFTGLTETAHTFEVFACDLAGNCDLSVATRSWSVDVTSPETTIDSGPSGPTASSTAVFAFSSSEAGTFRCRRDAQPFAACTSPITYNGLSETPHSFEVVACDLSGNCDQTPASRSWRVDLTFPDTTITSGPSGPVNVTSASFQFTSTEAGTFQCRRDAEAFGPCTSPHVFTGLTEAAHTFQVFACDLAGNCDQTAASRGWTVDLTRPVTSITGGPTGTVATTSATLLFSSTEAGTFQCRLDTDAFATCSTPRNYTDLPQGPHTFEVFACDVAGNCDLSSETRTWTVDTVPPDTTITGGPSGPTASVDATFTFTSSEPGTFQCRRDAQAFGLCTSPTSYTGLSQAPHTFDVYACDGVGNCDPTPATRAWTPDVTNPSVTITAPVPAPDFTTAAASIGIGGIASDNIALASVTWQNTSNSTSGTATGLAAWTDTVTLQAGPNVIIVTATDTTNHTATDTITITRDNTAPTVTITAPTSADTYTSQSAALTTLAGTAADNVALASVTWSNAANGASGTASGTTAWSVGVINLAAGTNVITVTATDTAGNTGTDVITVTRDNTAPTVTITAPTSAVTYTTSAATLTTLAGTAADNVALASVTWSNAANSSTGAATGTTAWSVGSISLVAGANVITVTATDTAGNTATDVITVTRDNTAPTVTITAPTSAATFTTAAETVALAGTASDPAGVATVTWANTTNSTTGSATGSTNWSVASVTLAAGANTIVVTATDAVGNTGTDTITVTRDNTGPTVTITDPTAAATYTTAGATVDLAGTAADPAGVATVTWVNTTNSTSGSATGLASWSATVTLAAGANTIVVTATDAVGNAGTDTITVTRNAAPVITSSATFNAAENQTAVGTVTSTDGDGDPPAYSRIGGPDIARFALHPTTGVLTFVAAPNFESPTDAGGDNVYDVTVQVSDGNGGSATQAIAVTVTGVNEAPVITSAVTFNAAENQTAVGTVTSADVDGGAPSYTIIGGADMASFSLGLGSGVLTFQTAPNFEAPTDDGANNVYDVIVQVSDGNGATPTQAIAVTVTGVNEAPVANPISPAAFNQDAESTITLSYSDPEGQQATVCTVVDVTNVAATTDCTCVAGACSVGVTGSPGYSGAASFDYTVTAGGQTSNAATATLTINDTAAPETTINGGPSGTVATGEAVFLFTSSEPGSFTCRLDGGAFTLCSSPHSFSGLADGNHTFDVLATDDAGNQDPIAASRSWTVDVPERHRYWRFLEQSVTVNHTPRTSELRFYDSGGTLRIPVSFVANFNTSEAPPFDGATNVIDAGWIVSLQVTPPGGNLVADFGPGGYSFTRFQAFSSYTGGSRGATWEIGWSDDNVQWSSVGTFNYTTSNGGAAEEVDGFGGYYQFVWAESLNL